MSETNTKSPRGFASWSPEKLSEVASKGGKAAHEQGAAHKFTSAEAQEAGRKGGRKIGADKAHMAEIGRKGGEARGTKARARAREAATEREAETKFAEENRPVNPFE